MLYRLRPCIHINCCSYSYIWSHDVCILHALWLTMCLLMWYIYMAYLITIKACTNVGQFSLALYIGIIKVRHSAR